MAGSETLGASFSIDVTALKAGLAQANRMIRESESEFKAAAAGMDDWSKSQEGLEARIKHLNKAQDLQTKKVEALKKQYEEAGYASDDMSAEAVKLRTEINREQEALNKTEKELREQTDALEEYRKIAKRLGETVDEVAERMGDLKEEAEDSGDGFTIAGGAVAGFIANGLTALVGACKNAISSVLGLAESTREYRNEMAKLETSFESANLSTEAAGKTFEELYSILGDEGAAVEASQQLAKIAKNEKDLEKYTRILTGVMGEYGTSIPTEGLAEGIAATANMGTVQGVLADALEWQGVNLDNFNEQLATMTSEEERASFIQETLTGLYGKSADKFKEKNASVIEANKAQAEHNETLAKFGEISEPIMTKVQQGFGKILEKVLELVQGVDFDALGEAIDGAFDWLVDTGIPAVLDFGSWVLDNIPTIATVIGGLTAAMVAHKVALLAATAASKGMTLAQYAMTAAQNLLNASFLANPIGLIILAITALVAAFVYLWKNCDSFRQFWIDLWEGIKKAAGAVADWFVKAWGDTVEWFSGAVDSIGTFFSDMWSGLKQGAADAWNGIKSVFSKVGSFFSNTFSNAWSAVKKVFSAGGKIFDGIKDGIVKAFKTVVNAIIRGINKVVKLPFEGLNKILDKISGVSIAGINPFSWLTWRATIPKIPELAKGGVVRGATHAIIGEDGAEAVVPLERNIQWIKAVAEELAKTQPNGVVVNQTNNYAQAHSRLELYKSKQATVAAVRLAMGGAK